MAQILLYFANNFFFKINPFHHGNQWSFKCRPYSVKSFEGELKVNLVTKDVVKTKQNKTKNISPANYTLSRCPNVTDISVYNWLPTQPVCVVQGHFQVVSDALIKTNAQLDQKKNTWPHRHSSIGVPQAPRHELGFAHVWSWRGHQRFYAANISFVDVCVCLSRLKPSLTIGKYLTSNPPI